MSWNNKEEIKKRKLKKQKHSHKYFTCNFQNDRDYFWWN